MANAESQRKIRQLAIVLSNIESALASRILGSMPADVSGAIRQQLQRLGAVSNAEREQAFESLRPILKAMSGGNEIRPSTKKHPPSSPQRSPAEQLVADGFEQQDFADISYDAQSQFAPAVLTPPVKESQRQDELGIDWHAGGGKAWAELLQSERPILIATVLAHAPETLAGEILQELPAAVALETLASMPKIGVTELNILKEIASQLNTRIQSVGGYRSAGGWGLQRAKGIVESLPAEIRKQWVKQIEHIDGAVARELAIIGSDSIADMAVAELPMDRGQADKLAKPANVKLAEHTRHHEPMAATYSLHVPSDLHGDENNNADVVAYDAEDFEALLKLSKTNLAQVIRQCQPETVLVALTGASRKWLAKFETMMNPREVSRLRERLKSLNNRPIRDVDEAQSRIVRAAVKLGLFEVPKDVLAA